MTSKVKAFLQSVWNDLVDTYKRIKVFLLGLVAIIVLIEWQKIKAILLIYLGKKQLQSAQKEDQILATSADQANKQADALVQQAEQLPTQKQTIPENWYENKGNE